LGDIFVVVTPSTILNYWSDSSWQNWHCSHDNHLDVCGATVVSRRWPGGVLCKLGGDMLLFIKHNHCRRHHQVLRFSVV